MPRLIKEEIYYDKHKLKLGSWCVNAVRRSFRKRKGVLFFRSGQPSYCRILCTKKRSGIPYRFKVSLCKVPIYRQALARQRECDYQDFVGKLRKGRSVDYKPCDRVALQQICKIEAFALEDRANTQQKQYLKHLKKQKYG